MTKALVVFSGGQDSTTCLGWALKKFDKVEAITFLYGQRHDIEATAAVVIGDKLGVQVKVVDLRHFFPQLVRSALVGEGEIGVAHPDHEDLPASFVPNRNALFMTIAHAMAQTIGAKVVITGMCETDYSGYPDCRQEFLTTINKALNDGSASSIEFLAPLMDLTKAETFLLAEEVGVLDTVLELSHTCYEGDRDTQHDWGWGCGECPACKLRAKGWDEFQEINHTLNVEDTE